MREGRVLPMISIAEAGRQEVDYIQGRKDGTIMSLKTPWYKLNKATMDGIEWGSIMTIAGMSGSGKTAILNVLETGLFEKNPTQDFGVLSFNFEMTAKRLVGRKISSKLQKSVKELYSADLDAAEKIAKLNMNGRIVTPRDLLTQRDIDAARSYVEEELSKYDVTYVDKSGTVKQIIATIEARLSRDDFKQNPDKGLLVTLDHSILVRGEGNVNEILYELASGFNDVKKFRKTAFIIVSQLNRSIESFERKTKNTLHYPQKSDVFGADALYMYSDVFLITHRPEMLNLVAYGPHNLPVKDKIYWHFIKTRDGEPFITRMVNNLRTNTITQDKS